MWELPTFLFFSKVRRWLSCFSVSTFNSTDNLTYCTSRRNSEQGLSRKRSLDAHQVDCVDGGGES